MNVISLPFSPKLALATSASSVTSELSLAELLEREFPRAANVEQDTGLLLVSESDAEVLSQFFYAFGFRLPATADGLATHYLWNCLQLKLGRIVRVALNGGDLAKLCANFTELELEYGRLVAAGNIAPARRLARQLFASTEYVRFFA